MKKSVQNKNGSKGTAAGQYVFSTRRTVRYRFPTHTNNLILDRAQATASEAFMVVLEPGEAPPLHAHHDTEQIFYVVSGTGTLYVGDQPGNRFRVNPGDLVRIPPRTFHRIRCRGSEQLVYLSVDCFPGGRPKDEPTWESHVRVMCAQNGWAFEEVRKNATASGIRRTRRKSNS
ncbi:MAG TPA: cupin domain-containing protein [Candidatus Limnocylindrales bacterium]|nr:cupin domain-containing protein [Candidatus Limnocylindrales bacterium]